MQKKPPQKNEIQAASLYSEKSLLAQCPFFIDRLDIFTWLLSLIIDFMFLSTKNLFEVSLEDIVVNFSLYL